MGKALWVGGKPRDQQSGVGSTGACSDEADAAPHHTAVTLAAVPGRAVVDRDERGAELATKLGGVFSKADVTSGAEVEAAVVQAAALGPLRVVVQCAGVGWASRTLDKTGKPHDLELSQKVIAINLVGQFNVLRLSAAAIAQTAQLDDGERGAIIMTASVAAFDGQI